MALLHDAQLSPSKPDLLTAWVPTQPWFVGDRDARVKILGSFRFDDPDGQVGIETFLVRFGDGPALQVPLTYRDSPLGGPGAPEPVATMEHSVLGHRWVYDGPSDPVYLAAVSTTILTGGREADLVMSDGRQLPSRGSVRGSGSQSGPAGDEADTGPGNRTDDGAGVELRRVVDPTEDVPSDPHLVGSWPGSDEPSVLAVVGRNG